MNTIEKRVKGIKTLAELQIDRIEGYEKVIEEADPKDIDLITIFKSMKADSEKAKNELEQQIVMLGEEPLDEHGSLLSSLHKVWIDIKSAISAKDRDSLLASCEFGDNVIFGAYEKTLLHNDNLGAELRSMLNGHKDDINKSLGVLKGLRKVEETIS